MTSAAPPVVPAGPLRDLIVAKPNILGINAQPVSNEHGVVGECSRRLGLTTLPGAGEGRPVFDMCSDGEPYELAKILPPSASVADVVRAMFAGATEAEKAAGFRGWNRLTITSDAVRTQVVGDVTVVDIAVPLPSEATNYMYGSDWLRLNLLAAVDTPKVSVLVESVPLCEPSQVC